MRSWDFTACSYTPQWHVFVIGITISCKVGVQCSVEKKKNAHFSFSCWDENRNNTQSHQAPLQTARVFKPLLAARRHAKSYSPTTLNSFSPWGWMGFLPKLPLPLPRSDVPSLGKVKHHCTLTYCAARGRDTTDTFYSNGFQQAPACCWVYCSPPSNCFCGVCNAFPLM